MVHNVEEKGTVLRIQIAGPDDEGWNLQIYFVSLLAVLFFIFALVCFRSLIVIERGSITF